jgi:hypothetical protein
VLLGVSAVYRSGILIAFAREACWIRYVSLYQCKTHLFKNKILRLLEWSGATWFLNGKMRRE